MRDVLIYGGKSFAEFNTFFDGSKSFGTPEKEYEIISIPGRNGDLSIFNNRYKDIVITFPCFIRQNFLENFRNLTEYLNSLNGYQRLETSKEPNHFRKALFLGLVNPVTGPFNQSGYFEISFRCNPQRWLKLGEEWFEYTPGRTSTIFNPTLQPAKPLIRATGGGIVTVGNKSFNLIRTHSFDYVDVDCDICDVYSNDGQNLNGSFYGSFPTIEPGANQIITVGASLKIQPRWYEI